MHTFYQSLKFYGEVTGVDLESATFTLQTRSGDSIQVKVGGTTWYNILTNLDNLSRDRVCDPDVAFDKNSPSFAMAKYVRVGEYLFVMGIYQENGEARSLEARTLHLPHWRIGEYLFEETHWWIDQISLMADQWLDNLFDSTRSYKIDDFQKFYRTNLNITGGPTNETIQECATLSRLIYGLSSAYLLTGSERYLLAASAGIAHQRQAYRSLSHDGEYCFWAYGRRPGVDGSKLVVPSENADDKGTIPLYEQIYALAGFSQYYRITQDWEVLEDIRRTVNTFQCFYHDSEKNRELRGFPGLGGYFSHLDYATMRPDTPGLGQNQSRKNWNSVGDHIPAYLVNLLLAMAAAYFAKLAADPVDPNYTVIATSKSIQLPANLTVGTNLASDESKAIALAAALITSFNRYQGAMAAGDSYWAAQQLAAVIGYSNQLNRLIVNLPSDLKAFTNQLVALGVPANLFVSTSNVFNTESQIASYGLSQEALYLFSLLGLSANDIQTATQDVYVQNINDLAGQYPGLLNTFAANLQPAGSVVPEPGSLSLFAAAILLLARRKGALFLGSLVHRFQGRQALVQPS